MGVNITSEMFSPEYQKFNRVKELTSRFNRGDMDWMPDKDKEQVAMLAAEYGTDFRPEAKPFKRALFNFADTATFGLVPDSIFKPHSIGEEYHQLRGADRIAGGIGTGAGFITGGALLAKGVGALGRGAKSLFSRFGSGGGGVGGGGFNPATNKMQLLNSGRDVPLLTSGAPRLTGRPLMLGSGRPPATGSYQDFLRQNYPQMTAKPLQLGYGRGRTLSGPVRGDQAAVYNIMRPYI